LEKNELMLNAFFSGSVKTMYTLPCFYPANVHHYYNGTEFNPNIESLKNYTDDMQYSVDGYISKDNYTKMLDEKWFGYKTPTVAHSYNAG